MIDNTKKPSSINQSLERSRLKLLPDTCEKAGSNNRVTPNAIAKAIKLISNDSPRNCLMREDFSAPNTFRIPTSAERLDERAVDKFMKLMHAISKVNKAIEARMYK